MLYVGCFVALLSRHSFLVKNQDNGKEFAKHQEIAEKLEISFYFCKPCTTSCRTLSAKI